MPDVSVIMPVYNGEKYITEAIESVLCQSFGDIELIICNDGSTDRTMDIAKQYAAEDKRIVIDDHEDIGQAANLNRGLMKALGEYICEVDADDRITSDHIENLYRAAKKHNADAVKCGFIEFGTEDGIEWTAVQQVHPGKLWCDIPLVINLVSDAFKNALICRTPCVFSGLYRKSFLLKNGLFWRPDVNYEDTSISFKIASAAKRFVWIDVATYYHRNGDPASGTSTIFDYEGLVEQMDECRRFSEKRHLDLGRWINAWSYYEYLWMLGRLKTPQDRKTFGRIMRREFQKHPTQAEYFNSADDFRMFEAFRTGRYL